MNPEIIQRIKLLISEAFSRRKLMVGMFIIISLATIFVGINWPKNYTSSASIYVEYKNIIDPLMEGTAVRTDITDIAGNAKEILFGRSMLLQVLEQSGSLDSKSNARDYGNLMEELKARTTISTSGKNLIKIGYQDLDPERAFTVTKTLTNILIREMLDSKTRESKAAYDFIDNEVKKYDKVLDNVKKQIDQLRTKNPDAQPGVFSQAEALVNSLVARVDDIQQELRDAEIIRESLRQQVSGEAEVYLAQTREEQNQSRIAELQTELASLRLNYRETHPDIIQIEQQIANLREIIHREGQHNEVWGDEGHYPINKTIQGGELYQKLKQQFYEANTKIKTLQARLADAENRLSQEQEKLQRIRGSKADFDNLTQDYNVSNAVYQDLLKRRENARVSLSLDTEQGRLTVRIAEPAFLPHQPDSPHLVHFAVGSVVLGSALPLALLFGVLVIDPRVRLPSTITEDLQLPMLEVIPQLATPKERRKKFRGIFWSSLFIALTLAIIIALFVTANQGQQPINILKDWLKHQNYFDCPSEYLPGLCSDLKRESADEQD